MFFESKDESASPPSERIFHAPSIDRKIVHLMISLLTKEITTSDLVSIDETLALLEAYVYLDVSRHKSRILARLWQLVRESSCIETLRRTSSHLLVSHTIEFLSKTKTVSNMEFAIFRRVFDGVDIDPSLARVVMAHCAEWFSPLEVLYDIVSHVSEDHKALVITECLSLYKIGQFFHPDEWFLATNMLLANSGGGGSRSNHHDTSRCVDIARNYIQSNSSYNPVTSLQNGHGSFISIMHTCHASFFLTRTKQGQKKCRFVFPHNTGMILVQSSSLEARFLLRKISGADVVYRVFMRMCYLPVSDHDTHEVQMDDATEEFCVFEEHEIDIDDHDAITFERRADLATVKHIRVDLWWNQDPRVR